MNGAGSRGADFRSDTVTRPCAEMRRRMAAAEVGDDVLGDDPTVRRLEEVVAGKLGKAAALFVPSGTMANQIAVKVQTQPGEEVLCEECCHLYFFEAGALGLISGVQARTFAAPAGRPDGPSLERRIRPHDVHHPRTAAILLENTHNVYGGRIVPLAALAEVRAVADRHRLKVHLDGARLWNAAVASGTSPAEFASFADSVSVCLSKGLGCPVGSLLAGSRELVDEARRVRKALGGGMRQAGILAAAGLFAVEHLVERLAEDHARARTLAERLADAPGCRVDPTEVETNIVVVQRPARDARAAQQALAEEGVLASLLGEAALRFVTHRDVGDADVERAVRAAHRPR